MKLCLPRCFRVVWMPWHYSVPREAGDQPRLGPWSSKKASLRESEKARCVANLWERVCLYISTECRFFDLDLRQIRHVTFPKDQVRGAHSLAPPPPASSRLRAASSAQYPSRCTQRKRCRDPRCSPRGNPACRGTLGVAGRLSCIPGFFTS